jgi:hypothetical protein
VIVLGAPTGLAEMIDGWAGEVDVRRRLGRRQAFVLQFVTTRAEIAARAPKVTAALDDDAVLWFAYPKKSSRRYRSDIGRDDSWQPLGDLGFEPVRQVAIDADWSALRFRRTEDIATLTRDPSMAMSAAGKSRTRRRA